MAEFLIKAKKHWLDDYTEAQALATFPYITSDGYNSRTTIGDIIAVRPDGWTWGTAECLPDFIVVKVTGLAINPDHERPLWNNALCTQLLKVRKFRVPTNIMDALIALNQSVITRTKGNFADRLEAKTS